MRVITLDLTCNNACVFCAQGDLFARFASSSSTSERGERAASSDVKAWLDAVCPGEVVALQGGEPTLRDDLPDLCAALAQRGARRILLQTNGRRLAYRAFARALRAATDKLSLNVSLHGSTEPMHDYHTQVAGSFRQTILGLRNARAEGLEASVTTVVTRSNYRHLADIVKVGAQLGVVAMEFVPAQRFGRAASAADRVIAPLELVRPYLSRAVAEARAARIGCVAFGQASEPGLEERFAGLGEVESKDRQVLLGDESLSKRIGAREVGYATAP